MHRRVGAALTVERGIEVRVRVLRVPEHRARVQLLGQYRAALLEPAVLEVRVGGAVAGEPLAERSQVLDLVNDERADRAQPVQRVVRRAVAVAVARDGGHHAEEDLGIVARAAERRRVVVAGSDEAGRGIEVVDDA